MVRKRSSYLLPFNHSLQFYMFLSSLLPSTSTHQQSVLVLVNALHHPNHPTHVSLPACQPIFFPRFPCYQFALGIRITCHCEIPCTGCAREDISDYDNGGFRPQVEEEQELTLDGSYGKTASGPKNVSVKLSANDKWRLVKPLLARCTLPLCTLEFLFLEPWIWIWDLSRCICFWLHFSFSASYSPVKNQAN